MSDQIAAETTRDLTVTRVFDAPIERVWSAWSEAEQVMQWWGPDGFTSPTCRMDFREGGTTIVHMHSPQFGDMYNTWAYQRIEALRRIEFIQNFADSTGTRLDPAALGLPEGVPTAVRHVVTFEAAGDHRTTMTVTELGYTSEGALELSKLGLEQCLDKMAASFT